ncbi:MAG: carbamate kinase [Defluviitaleaceae bacterium]|nr:carbamate kinase [Defluviitaleaceae bacterium]
MSKIVIALGGNALGNDSLEQMEKVKIAAKAIADLVQDGHEILISHGNGPQVGMIKKAFDECEKQNITPNMPFPECIAMSQGYIGFHLQAAIETELFARKITDRPVSTLVTRIVVDANDPAFLKPTKPIGSYYDEQTAIKLMQETGDFYGEDAGRGFRRMIASPMPVDIMEKETVELLLQNKRVVIACGGGGIPVTEKNGLMVGIDAVVDKDFAASHMAKLIDADMLIILTAVDNAFLNYQKENETVISQATVSEAKKYCEEGHFAPGSMLPKVMASYMFTENGKNKHAIITSLERAADALKGECGTTVVA